MVHDSVCISCTTKINVKPPSNDGCKKCKSLDLYIHEVESVHVCRDCGFVGSTIIKDTAEWTNYTGDSNRKVMSRCSMSCPINLAASLGTSIPPHFKGNFFIQKVYTDSEGKIQTKRIERNISKLNTWQSKTSEEQCYDRVIKYLNKFGWDDSIIRRTLLYWKMIKKSHYKGRKRDALIALCVHYALCNNPNANHSPSFVCKKMNIRASDFTQVKQIFPQYRILQSFNSTYCKSLSNIYSFHMSKLNLPFKHYVPSCLKIYNENKTKLQQSRFTPNTIKFGVIYTVLKRNDKLTPKKIEYLKTYCSVHTMKLVFKALSN